MGFPLSYHVGTLGFSGLTAYGGYPRKAREYLFLLPLAPSEIWQIIWLLYHWLCRKQRKGQLLGCGNSHVYATTLSHESLCIPLGALLKEKFGFDDAFTRKKKI
ncbi:hypothetical protein ACFE04_000640 [Oxalis oulophora]